MIKCILHVSICTVQVSMLWHIQSLQYTVYCNYTACLQRDAEIPDLLYRKGILRFHGCSPGLSQQSQLYTYLIILFCFFPLSLSLSLSSAPSELFDTDYTFLIVLAEQVKNITFSCTPSVSNQRLLAQAIRACISM